MKRDTLERKIQAARRRLEGLERRTNHLPVHQQALTAEALEQLSVALQELHVAAEELREQNEELMATRMAVEEEHQRYQGLFDFAPDGYLVTDPEGVIQEANRVAAALFGVRQNFLKGKPLVMLLPEGERKGFHTRLSHLQRTRLKRRVEDWDIRLQPRDGLPFPVAMSVALMRDDAGRLTGMRWLLRDMTERKRAEEQYQAVVRAAMDGFWVTDVRGKFLDVNDAYCRLMGYSRDELLTMSVADVEAMESAEETNRHMRGVIETGRDRFETRHRCKDGKVIDLAVSANYMAAAGGRFIVFLRDVTERNWAAEELRKAHDNLEERVRERTAEILTAHEQLKDEIAERYRTEARLRLERRKLKGILDGMEDGAYIVDQHYDIQYVNPVIEKEFGRVEGRKCHEYFHDLPQACPWCRNQEVFAGKTVHDESFYFKTGKTYQLADIPVTNADGSTSKLKILHDIADRKRAEEALRESQEQLRYLSSQLLLAQEKERKRIAQELHDSIAAQLAAIKFAIERTLEQFARGPASPDPGPLEAVVPLARGAMEEIRRISRDLWPSLLDDLGVLVAVQSFCREFQQIHTGLRVELEMGVREEDVPSPLKIVIYRVLQEALNNIAKHSKTDLARLSLNKRDQRIELAVEDNGIGFDQKDALSPENPRRGMGLFGMRERTELSGGIFSIESASGAGTKIRAEWPV